ncbi:putative inorganic phosphate cotransporter isoform X2 [Agrilus planipennis]|uniref:Inorganic phosphate cotransporter isoform X2 n=1 Tax=Agrilus planipennis TaxID=224129 RepID=A0A1W4WUJ3_AGRPL|nr:putative inorganic phosphate cotransporter isoform X2 [Agrilus planipennis]
MLLGWRLKVSKIFFIPQRVVMSIFGFLAILNSYTMRGTMSIAITEMVVTVARNSTSSSDDTCSGESSSSSSSQAVTNPDLLFDWNEATQGLILSAFYWGYVATHIPGAFLTEKFGAKQTLGIGMLITALFTLFTPLITLAGGWQWLIIARVCVGLGEGVTFPALTALIAKWVPLEERGRLGSLIFAGSQLGSVFGNALSGILIEKTETWTTVFYFFGGLGVIWFVLYCVLVYSSPGQHPFISDEEKKYLDNKLEGVSKEKLPIPWKPILRSVPLWGLVICQIGHDWILFAMVTDLPTYMRSVLHFSVSQNGLLSALPYLVMWLLSLVFGTICDFVVNKSYMSVAVSRKFFTTIASAGPAIFVVLASYAGCNRTLTVAFFTIGMGFMGAYYCSMKVNVLDLSPNFAGVLMAITNGVGAISGIVTPYLIGLLTPDQTLSQWRIVFWMIFAVTISTNIVYVILGSAEIQWWNEKKNDDTEKGTKREQSLSQK